MKAIVWQGPDAMARRGAAGAAPTRARRADPAARGGRDLRLGGRGLPRPHGQPHPAAGDGPRVRRARSSRPAKAPSELDGARVAVNPLERLRRVPAVPRRATRTSARTACWSACTSPARSPTSCKVRAADARVLPDGVSARVGALMEPLANGVHAVRLGRRTASRAPSCSARARSGSSRCRPRCSTGILARRRRRAAGRAARARRARSAPTPSTATPEEAKRRGRAGPRARRGRRAGHPRARARAAAPRRDAWSASASPPTTRRSASTASIRGQHRIQGSYAYTMPDFEQAHEWLVSGQATLGDDLPDGAPARGRAGAVRAARRRPAAARVQGLPGRRGREA